MNVKIKCEDCGVIITSNNIKLHKNSKKCLENKNGKIRIKITDEWKIDDDQYKCPECNYITGKQGIGIHIWRMHTVEGSKYDNGLKGKKGTNHYIKAAKLGLTKPSMSIEGRLSISERNKKRKLTQQTKDKISKSRKLYLDNNKDKTPYKLNHSSKQSYPEKYFSIVLCNYKNIEKEYSVLRYNLDFANPEHKLYLEIDGEQHYVDNKIIQHDIKRNSKLETIGWKGFRLRWSHYQKLNLNERIEKINEIKRFLKI